MTAPTVTRTAHAAIARCANHDWAASPCPAVLSRREVAQGYTYCRGCRKRLLAVPIDSDAPRPVSTGRPLIWWIE